MYAHHRRKLSVLLLLLLAVCSGCVRRDAAPPRDTAPQHTVSTQTATWNMDTADVYVSPPTVVSISYTLPWARQFGIGFAVQARVVEVLPDIYALPEKTLNRESYRILRMELMDTITGSGVPQEFYYLLGESYDPNLTHFDSLIISMRQMGIGSYMMFNTAQCRYERFFPLFASGTVGYMEEDYRVYPDPTEINLYNTLSVLPFTDGILDTSIYTLPGWERDKNMLDNYIDVFPIAKGHTLQQAKDAIRAHQDAFMANYGTDSLPFFEKLRTVQYPDLYPDEAAYQVLCGFEKGVFAQITSQDQKTVFCRIINGFYTNEYYSFTPGQPMTASDARFTQAQIDSLPDLKPALDLAMQQVREADPRRIDLLDGYYYQTAQGIYGVIRAYWNGIYSSDLRDAQINYLVFPDGEVMRVSTKVLELYLQDDRQNALLQQTWETISRKAYKATAIYRNTDLDYVSTPRGTVILNENFSLTCADAWYGPAEVPLTLTDPAVIDLETLVSPDSKYWTNTAWSKDALLADVQYAWQLTPDTTNLHNQEYLLLMETGDLLMIRCTDYTDLLPDQSVGLQIPLILHLDADYDY